MKTTLFAFATLLVPVVFGQSSTSFDCSRTRYCEMREQTISSTGRFAVEDLRNGSITVRGTNRSDVLVRARVEVDARSENEARDAYSRVHTHVTAGRFSVDGPLIDNPISWFFETNWSVSVELEVPNHTDLVLTTRNGQIRASDISGRVELDSRNGAIRLNDVAGDVRFDSRNGSVSLSRVGGSVQGESRNGAIDVELAGNSFAGRRVDVESRNGAVNIALPRTYSAHVVTDTRNGRLNSDFPITVRGRISHNGNDGNREFDLGSGGSPIRVTTRNGGIRLRQI